MGWTDDLRGRMDELLDEYRAALRGSLDGLDDTYVEGVWFDQAVTGRSYREIGIARTPDQSFTLTRSDTIASVLDAHAERCDESRLTMAGLALDDKVDGRGERTVRACTCRYCVNSPSMPVTPTYCASRSSPTAFRDR
ncbi:DUF664 domain-containing protein [Rhodococcus opacus]|uniref:mycothiol transferase n=1 Tax=Rhodococcus opacus TaxID=37919 RepID=UPI003145025B